MKLRRLRAVARKEFIHVFRDARSLAMAVAMPVVLLLLFGYALTLDVDDVPLAVWDQSQSQASRELVSRFSGSPYFRVGVYARDYRQVEQAIDRRVALAALVIPTDFAGRLESGRPAPVQLILDGSDSNTATIALGYAQSVAQAYSTQVMVSQAERLTGQSVALPLDVRPRVWFNEDLRSRNFIIPGLIAVIMMVIAALLTALTVAREWERGTMEQLISTPITRGELVFGKLLPYFVIGLFDMAVAVLMGRFLFAVPLRGSVMVLFATGGVFLVGALSLGLTISIVARNQLLASQVALVATFLPAFLLSGFAFAIEHMPAVIRAVTCVIPARYFVAMLKAIYLKGLGLSLLWAEAVLLACFAAVMLVVANLKFRKRLE